MLCSTSRRRSSGGAKGLVVQAHLEHLEQAFGSLAEEVFLSRQVPWADGQSVNVCARAVHAQAVGAEGEDFGVHLRGRGAAATRCETNTGS